MSVLCHNCRFDGNAKDAAFCSRCGSSLNAANANTSYAPPPTQQAYPAQAAPQYANGGQQLHQQPQVVHAVPVVQQPQYVVVQAQPQVLASGEFIVVPGQVLTATGHCAHAVQTNEFTCPGVLLGILFFPIGILCCLLLTERRCVHCGTILN
ncbi:hypothetical protein H310_03507 [Aphanomyces invadans]|uniref:Membrane protein BRI3 n=1 Tax=Aphanomyces invadans TaxID=157072 RepID=A0A024UI17_9STRA|nr:hypothetical protein H310_03507 [Aphanomyces invadans]ETW05845.1 hypothetical protein H310_03507 [Aphanomyces invadans]|eukprot:XP_008865622.1 hypothetical protein H310_03507 [Aphanomyces invadans]